MEQRQRHLSDDADDVPEAVPIVSGHENSFSNGQGTGADVAVPLTILAGWLGSGKVFMDGAVVQRLV
jgi:hypothetical protein